MKKHYETHVEDTDKLISVAGPVLDYKSWYEQYRKLMEEQAQRKYGLYTPTSEGDGDDFPSIPGMIARYSALGLTNEQMATNPVWVDKTGNGYDLQMKNFAWSGMSGVDGYEYNFLSSDWAVGKVQLSEALSYKITIVDKRNSVQLFKYIRNESENTIKITLKVTGIEINGCIFKVYDNASMSHAQDYKKDGIYQINYTATEGSTRIYFYVHGGNMGQLDNPITIEQLPIYSGALVFDGVDDYGVCDNFPILTKEKGYTVVALRQWITRGERALGLVSNVKDWLNNGAFLLEYRNIQADHLNKPISFGAIGSEMDLPHILTYQTSKSYNGVSITTGNFEGTDVLHVGKLAPTNVGTCINAAIWELVFLDHDATEEELTKIKDYFVKTYPWLFLDQAWTVAGKTNEDEDRATIANITGNGNDLVLSNFGFSGNSGYGLYQQNYAIWTKDSNRATFTVTSSKIHVTSVTAEEHADFIYTTGQQLKQKIRITGLPEGASFVIGRSGVNLKIISQDGIYDVDILDDSSANPIIGYRINRIIDSCDITIEQIPEYEGYLITDGVDDEIISAKLIQFADKFTIVGDWKFMEDRKDNAGLLKANQIYIYNATTGMRIYLKQGSKNYSFSCKKINALTSDGWVYDEKWDKYKVYPIGSDIDISSRLFLGFYNSNFTKIALKNLGIYNDQLLSKDDCIKAYNYLQTLKAK